MRDAILDQAFSIRGVNAKVARACGISTAAVAQWRRVPKERLETVAKVLGIPANQLRPDIASTNSQQAA
jgi:pyruvate kinase